MNYLEKLCRQRQWVMTGLMLLCMLPDSVIHAASIRITWNANQESDLDGYKVYYGTATGTYGSPIDVGNITAYEISGLTAGTRYFIALTAYDTSDNESAQSDEISGIAQSSTTITTTLPSSTTTSATSSIPPMSTTTSALISTTIPAVTTQPSSTSTTALQLPTTSTIYLITTTIPVTSTQPSSSTSSTEPETTTTTTSAVETASCEQPSRLQPIAVTASTPERIFFPVANIIDGDPQTSWATFFTMFKRDASIILDLGSEKTITSLALYATRIFGIDFLPVTLELQISSDHDTWRTINAAAESTDLESGKGDSWQLHGHSCRYIKLSMGRRKSFFLLQLAQIGELEIYGCTADGHPPFSAQAASSAALVGAAAAPNPSSLTTVSEEEPVTPGVPGRPFVSFQ